MVRLRLTSLVGFALTLTLAIGPMQAQDKKGGGGGRRGGFGGMMAGMVPPSRFSLVRQEQVQTEIKLGKEEKDKIDELAKSITPSNADRASTKGLSQEEKKKVATEAREKYQKAVAESDKKLEGILKPEQAKRLEEIYIQQRGAQSLKDEKIAKELKITDEQKGKVDGAIKWGEEERAKLIPTGGAGKIDREAITELREKQEKLQKEVDTKILASLTDEQKSQFEKMKGSPFALERQNRGGGGQGGGGGGNKKGGNRA